MAVLTVRDSEGTGMNVLEGWVKCDSDTGIDTETPREGSRDVKGNPDCGRSVL